MPIVHSIRPAFCAFPISLALLLAGPTFAQDEAAEGSAVQALDDFSDLADEAPDTPDAPVADDSATQELYLIHI